MIMMVPSVIIILLCSVFKAQQSTHIYLDAGWTMKYHSHFFGHIFWFLGN